jgi:hypothetical protein
VMRTHSKFVKYFFALSCYASDPPQRYSKRSEGRGPESEPRNLTIWSLVVSEPSCKGEGDAKEGGGPRTNMKDSMVEPNFGLPEVGVVGC